MMMKNAYRPSKRMGLLVIGWATVLIHQVALANGVSVSCPASAASGSNVTVEMSFENDECSAASVRVISSIVGNADNSLGGIGIHGPVVAEPMLIVPAGTDVFCGCVANQCQCGEGACSVDSDCSFCSAQTPGTLSALVDVEPVLPPTLDGTVATVLLLSEIEIGDSASTQVNECFVEVL